MIKSIAIALIVLSLTACITVEIPAPEYPELPEMDELSEASDAADKASDAVSVGAKPKQVSGVTERSTPRPADTPLPAATVQPANHRPDTSQIVVISNESLLREMMGVFERNIHLAEKNFDDKWIWFLSVSIESVERNRIRLYSSSNEYVVYARFPPDAGLEDLEYRGGGVEMLCFDPTYYKRNDIRTLTVSDCEITDSNVDPDKYR